jgi:N-acetylneuraminate synthase
MKNKIHIIAEIGINHNGDLEIAKKMIKIAKNIGADSVKFQKRDLELVYSKKELDKFRESPWGTTNRKQKEGLEFSKKDYEIIDEYSKNLGIDWFASAWDINSLNFLKEFNLKYNKIASAMIVDKDFLEEVAKQKKYTFISTGMCEESDIDDAVKIFKKNKCEFELMHCVSAYPFDDRLANLSLINYYKEKYHCKVGYSGHETGGLSISYAAAAMGISSLERHFTLDRSLYGSDQSASLEPKGLEELIGGIRKIEEAIKPGVKKNILDIEKPVAEKLRAHIKK